MSEKVKLYDKILFRGEFMKPFRDYEISKIIESRKNDIKKYIEKLSDDEIISNQDEIIVYNMIDKHKFILVEINDELIENRKLSKEIIRKANMFYRKNAPYEPPYWEVEGVKVTCVFPFIGDNLLFYCSANTFSLGGHPDIDLYDNYFSISASETLDVMTKEENRQLLFNKINRDLQHIKEFIGYCNAEAKTFNSQIEQITRTELNKRREKIDKFYSISKLLEIPIERTNPKIIEEIKIERKIIPLVKNNNNIQEYSISDEIYNDILELIKHQGSTFERTPEVYNGMYEEQLRDIILAFLNGLFNGKANGECFRKHGKTDILIEYENRAAFIAECKVWAGKKVFQSTLEQLQNYTTWRDNKLCVIMFSRNKDFFKVLEEIKNTMPQEENYLSYKEIDKNEFELKLKSKNNDGQILKIRIYAFDLSI